MVRSKIKVTDRKTNRKKRGQDVNKDLLRVYVDTSVVGGVLDSEFADPSQTFLQKAARGEFKLVLSSVVADEVYRAPSGVRDVFREIAAYSESFVLNDETIKLRRAYLEAGAVSPKWQIDALHVAAATVSGCQAIVSWNFKHIVNYRRISVYNAVNTATGYGPIAIHSPLEMIADED